MNSYLETLQPYPFERLRTLKEGIVPQQSPEIFLSIGEPKHAAPAIATDALINSMDKITRYPSTLGTPELRTAISDWLLRRFHAQVDPSTQIIPCNGTREGIFSLIQAIVNRHEERPLVAMPNPFYQIYEGATLLAGAQPLFLNVSPDCHGQPNFDAVDPQTWKHTQLLMICTPGNPTGECLSLSTLKQLIELADTYDFIIASDECYSELYPADSVAPAGLLQACAELGRADFSRCLAIHSLSKRSNLPGLRSGFIAGDANIIKPYTTYRTYHGCAMSLPTQQASIAAWSDEQHVEQNRCAYDEKYAMFVERLSPYFDIKRPDASFYIWLSVKGDDQHFARELFRVTGITVLPGTFLARTSEGINPGTGFVRIALVAPLKECSDAADRIVRFMESHHE